LWLAIFFLLILIVCLLFGMNISEVKSSCISWREIFVSMRVLKGLIAVVNVLLWRKILRTTWMRYILFVLHLPFIPLLFLADFTLDFVCIYTKIGDFKEGVTDFVRDRWEL